MSSVLQAEDAMASATVQAWSQAARRARTRRTRRWVRVALLAPIAVLSAAWIGMILWWAVRGAVWWALVPMLAHVGAILLALGWPTQPSLAATAPQDFTARIVATVHDRLARLRALRQALLVEWALLFALPLVQYLVAAQPVRWGITFTAALSALCVVWPLECIARAQREEGARLLALHGDDR